MKLYTYIGLKQFPTHWAAEFESSLSYFDGQRIVRHDLQSLRDSIANMIGRGQKAYLLDNLEEFQRALADLEKK